jgi:hypothetical protein
MTTIVTRAGKGSALTHNEVDANFTNLNNAKYESGNNATLGTIQGSTITATTGFSGALNGTVGATTPAAGTFTSLTDSGNLSFTGTGNRITGDMSNATFTNRVYVQNSIANNGTDFGLLPNGTATQSQLGVYNNSDPTNSSRAALIANASEISLRSGIIGTGTLLPMTFHTGGSERMRIDTSGNVGIGTSSIISRFTVEGGFNAGATGSQPAITTRGAFGGGIGFFDTATSGLYAQDAGQTLNLFVGQTGSDTAASKVSMTFKGNGNVGIGTSSPVTKLNISGSSGFSGELGTLAITGNTSAKRLAFGVDSTSTMYGWIQSVENGVSARDLVLQGLGGNVLVGTTAVLGSARTTIANVNGAQTGLSIGNSVGSATTTAAAFFNSNGEVGFIQTSGSSTVYSTSSDYRLKENIAPMVGALETVAQLKPVTYNWKADGSDGQGFIAHELQGVVPECVTGEKDAVDKEGNPVYQGIDTSFLVATLTAAIQELSAKVEALEAQLNKE